jgi:hypothetical protein
MNRPVRSRMHCGVGLEARHLRLPDYEGSRCAAEKQKHKQRAYLSLHHFSVITNRSISDEHF